MDIFQEYGNDLVIDNNGDLKVVDGIELSNQNIIRRLLTTPLSVSPNPDYMDHPDYGAGLPQFVGAINSPDTYEKIDGLITSNMLLEQSVSQTPPPEIELTGLPNQLNGTISYTNALTNTQVVIPIDV